MKRRILIVGLALAGGLSLQAQELKLKVDPKGRIGFVDAKGEQRVACQYSSAQPFEGGLSIVTKGEKVGAVNAEGVEVVKPQYDEVSRWGKGLLLVKKGKKWGLASGETGKLCVPVAYSYISHPNHYGKAWLVKGGSPVKSMKTNATTGAQEQHTVLSNAKVGIVNADGTVSIEAKQKGLFEFAKTDVALLKGCTILLAGNVTMGDTCLTDCQYLGFNKTAALANSGVMDGQGKILMNLKAHTYVTMPRSGMMAWLDTSKKTLKFGYRNVATGQEFEALTTASPEGASEKAPLYVTEFHGELAAVSTTGAGHDYKLINKEGKTLSEGFTTVEHSDNSKAWAGVTAQGECTLLSDQGQSLLPEGMKVENVAFSATATHKELISAKQGGKWGVVSCPEGRVVVPFSYDQVNLSYDLAFVNTEGKKGAIDPATGKIVIPLNYTAVFVPREAGAQFIWCKKADGLLYAYDRQRKAEATQGYANATNFFHHLAFASPKGMKVDSSQVARAQMAYNATDKDFSQAWAANNFGQIINERGEVVAQGPVYRQQFDKVATLLHEQGAKPLSPSENKALLLKLTRQQRSYPLGSKIEEADWDF